MHQVIRTKMYPYSQFFYNAYWKVWSRILQFRQPLTGAPQIEIDLRIDGLYLRKHVTERSKYDIVTPDLPIAYVEELKQKASENNTHISEQNLETFLHKDILSYFSQKIINDVFTEHTGGGGVALDYFISHKQ